MKRRPFRRRHLLDEHRQELRDDIVTLKAAVELTMEGEEGVETLAQKMARVRQSRASAGAAAGTAGGGDASAAAAAAGGGGPRKESLAERAARMREERTKRGSASVDSSPARRSGSANPAHWWDSARSD